jgi:phage regulator Rha-like protein
MLDSDLAELFGTETKYINRSLKRNPDRFPSDFAFVLTEKEWQDLRFQIGTLEIDSGRGKFRKYLPFAFTERGVAMLSAVLQTDVAIEISIQIIRAFIAMRKTFGYLHGLLQRMDLIELKQLHTDTKLEKVLNALKKDFP